MASKDYSKEMAWRRQDGPSLALQCLMHTSAGASATFRCPVFEVIKKLCATIFFVDDCDLLHIAMTEIEHLSTTHKKCKRVFSIGVSS